MKRAMHSFWLVNGQRLKGNTPSRTSPNPVDAACVVGTSTGIASAPEVTATIDKDKIISAPKPPEGTDATSTGGLVFCTEGASLVTESTTMFSNFVNMYAEKYGVEEKGSAMAQTMALEQSQRWRDPCMIRKGLGDGHKAKRTLRQRVQKAYVSPGLSSTHCAAGAAPVDGRVDLQKRIQNALAPDVKVAMAIKEQCMALHLDMMERAKLFSDVEQATDDCSTAVQCLVEDGGMLDINFDDDPATTSLFRDCWSEGRE